MVSSNVEQGPEPRRAEARQRGGGNGQFAERRAWSEATLGARKHAAEHVVFLVPGLLGFENFSTFAYFEDRVVASLRAALEQSWKQPAAVVAVPIPPTASLRLRQEMLVQTIARRLEALEKERSEFRHIHLIGHSTGGVDANLLTDDRALGDRPWSELDARAPSLIRRIRSVVSIASPHQGACITRDPVAGFFRDHDPTSLPEFGSLAAKLLVSSFHDQDLFSNFLGAVRGGRTFVHFVGELLKKWPLLDDLLPTRSSRLNNPKSDVMRRSFVTIAGRRADPSATTPDADEFFHQLSERASGTRSGCAEQGELVAASVERLNAAIHTDSADVPVIMAEGTELPGPLDAGHNDGVVNSARQLINPADSKELAGIVVGDHFDVVGYYDRHTWLRDRDGREQYPQVLSGLLHSGSGFRDDQFFELYGHVAKVLAEARY